MEEGFKVGRVRKFRKGVREFEERGRVEVFGFFCYLGV